MHLSFTLISISDRMPPDILGYIMTGVSCKLIIIIKTMVICKVGDFWHWAAVESDHLFVLMAAKERYFMASAAR